tara:strand:- start:14725 stop:15750 length:1026 start_codon:yes stop_codon:yes gene_type:complete
VVRLLAAVFEMSNLWLKLMISRYFSCYVSRYGRAMIYTLLSVGIIGVSSCGFFDDLSQTPSGVARGSDSAPKTKLDVKRIKDAVPRVEPKSRGGNFSPYTVLGKTYTVLDSSKGYKARGDASWYGTKFHGRLTSNGERYNMYAMSAAHKSLPIPTYVKVTNLENRRQIIVRVNDRGPFYPGRIIDLSYAGASKLDMLKKGTARVEVEAIDPRQWKKNQKKQVQFTRDDSIQLHALKSTVDDQLQSSNDSETSVDWSSALPEFNRYYLQVAAFSSLEAAQSLQNRLLRHLNSLSQSVNVVIRPSERGVYRVRIGPFSSEQESLTFEKISELQFLGKMHLISE